MEEEILLLADLLDAYENETLDISVPARKCYLTEKEKYFKRVSWIHNHELKNHLVLRRIGMNSSRDLLRHSKEKL